MKKSTFIFYKPYGVLSQFTREVADHKVIGDYYKFPEDVYPVGRLDKDSEGLLVLTNDKKLVDTLLHPSQEKKKVYWVQVDGQITAKAVQQLSEGVIITLPNKTKYKTLHCKVKPMHNVKLEERDPPVRFRANIPTSWIQMTIHEGKNHQIRKMCAAVGFPVLRLVRIQVGPYLLDDLNPGGARLVKE